MAANVKFNYKNIELALAKPIAAASLPVARRVAKEKFNKDLDILINEIEQDPVSQEIIAGPEEFKSKFIKGKGTNKYGANLFSFLGFQADTNPISDLTNYIKNSSKINLFNIRLINNEYKFKVTLPTEAEVKSAHPLEWTNRSWITAIERGVSNVINYIRKIGKGRSGGGIQIEHEMNKKFIPRKNFFSEKYKRFVRRLQS